MRILTFSFLGKDNEDYYTMVELDTDNTIPEILSVSVYDKNGNEVFNEMPQDEHILREYELECEMCEHKELLQGEVSCDINGDAYDECNPVTWDAL